MTASLLAKLLSTFCVLAVFFGVLCVVYLAYMKLMYVNVVLYASIFVGLIASSVCVLLLFLGRWFEVFTSFEKIQLSAIMLLLSYAFAISVPTVIDRSLSFYILEKLQQRGGGIQRSKFEYIFTVEYMREARLVDVRLTEQVQSGTIYISGDCVKLTMKGEWIATVGRFFRSHLYLSEGYCAMPTPEN